jgi:hypothetical protein
MFDVSIHQVVIIINNIIPTPTTATPLVIVLVCTMRMQAHQYTPIEGGILHQE